MKRVMVTGAAGQLGSAVVDLFSRQADVVPFTRSELDIADDSRVVAVVASVKPNVIINCAAYNNVDGAETSALPALSANALGVRALARAARDVGATLVHYSTDFVFDGMADRPYVEADPPRPLSNYGMSKLLGEWFAFSPQAIDVVQAAYVLRVESLFGGEPAKSSIDKILTAIRTGTPVRVFRDRTVSPSYVGDVAWATAQLLNTRAPFGLYHCVNSGVATWVEVAEAAVRLLGREAEIVAVSVTEVKLQARRPQYCALSNVRLGKAGIVMPRWEDALARYLGAQSRPPDARLRGTT
jgi:dTDP-4-dehydrorhamnose reductase